MGLGLQPAVARITYPFNCLVSRTLAPHRPPLVLTYHRIGDRRQLWPEAAGLAECTLSQFEAQMAWLRQHCTVLELSDTLQILNRGTRWPRRSVLVTFDDGYRDDMLRVQPCLERLRIRPVMFVATDYVGSGRRFWWDRIGCCLQTTVRRRLRMSLPNLMSLPLESARERDAACRQLLAHAKRLEPSEREGFLTDLEERLGVGDTRLAPEPLVASWEELRALQSTFDIGAHTRSHPVLSQLSAAEIESELGGSRAVVEEQLGRECTAFAVPFGASADYNPAVLRAADRVGFRLAVSLEDTLRAPKRYGRTWLLDRVTLNASAAVESLAAKLIWPAVFVPDWSGRLQERLARLWRAGAAA